MKDDIYLIPPLIPYNPVWFLFLHLYFLESLSTGSMLNCDGSSRRQLLIQCGGYGNLRRVLMLLQLLLLISKYILWLYKFMLVDLSYLSFMKGSSSHYVAGAPGLTEQ